MSDMKKLTKKQFTLLVLFTEGKGNLSQRELADRCGFSVGTVNKLLSEMTEAGWIRNSAVTDAGLAVLEPYRVKRAVIIAAGFGSRLVPITLNTPKPLVRVKGKRIIDSILDAVTAAGIQDIVIVRGYLGEQFDQLVYKYPTVRFVENPMFNEANNISSVECVRYLLSSAYVIEADLLLYNPTLITKYQYETNYLGVPTARTDDWCFVTDGGYIQKLSIGGTDCHHMFGISYWSEEDGKRLGVDVDTAINAPGGKELYWDQVALEKNLGKYRITVRECSFDDITEIDTFNELKKIDPTYNM